MLRTFLWYLLAWLHLIIHYPVLLRAKYLEKQNREQELHSLADKAMSNLCKFLFYSSGSKIKMIGMENVPKEGAVLFVSNHQSHMDNAIIHGFINKPKGFISIIEVQKFLILRTWMKYMQCVFMDRKDLRQTFMCIDKAIKLLKSGHSMVIYPEGKLGENGVVGEFMKGSLKLAIKAGVPIVPITLRDSFKVMTKDGSRIKPASVECIISEPIMTSNFKKDEEKELSSIVRNSIIKNI
jgi:1-acyl-sn-glycerol-3-phosphate acyltransferase